MFRVWTKNLGRVGKSEAHVYVLALTCSDAEQLGKPFLLKGNFIFHIKFQDPISNRSWPYAKRNAPRTDRPKPICLLNFEVEGIEIKLSFSRVRRPIYVISGLVVKTNFENDVMADFPQYIVMRLCPLHATSARKIWILLKTMNVNKTWN